MKGQNIHWFSDNQGTISVINYGSMKVHLQKLALDIFSLCLNNNISIYLEWIPRNLNEIADAISKFIDYDDWRTTDGFFIFLNTVWGPFTIDRFASEENKKLQRFNSLFWNPGTERVNAFRLHGRMKTTGWFHLFTSFLTQFSIYLHVERRVL